MRKVVLIVVLLFGLAPVYAQESRPLHTMTIRGDEFAGINGAAFSPDGASILAWAGNNRIYVWDADNGRRRFSTTLTGRGWWVDPELIVTYDYDEDETTLWNVETRRDIYTVTNISPLDILSPDGQTLITTEPGTVTIREATTGGAQHTLENLPFDWFWLDATTIGAITGVEFQMWDVTTGEQTNRFAYEGFVTDHTADRLLTASQSIDTRLRLYDINRGLGVRFYRVSGAVSQARVAESGETIYVVSRFNDMSSDRMVVWDIAEGEAIVLNIAADDETRNILDFALSPDETRMLTLSFAITLEDVQVVPESEQASIWDVTSGERLLAVSQPGLAAGTWAPGGEAALVWGSDGGSLLDANSGDVLMRFREGEYIGGAAFGPDANTFITWGEKTLNVWERP